jgi:insulysin
VEIIPPLSLGLTWSEHWDDVALAIFKYISLLRSAPPSSVIFEDLKQMAGISFRFAEKHKPDSYCVELTGGMQDPVPREKIISAKWLIEEFNQEELKNTLLYLDPRKAAIGVTSRELPKGVEGTFDLKEPIYGTEHKRMRASDEFMKEVSLDYFWMS